MVTLKGQIHALHLQIETAAARGDIAEALQLLRWVTDLAHSLFTAIEADRDSRRRKEDGTG